MTGFFLFVIGVATLLTMVPADAYALACVSHCVIGDLAETRPWSWTRALGPLLGGLLFHEHWWLSAVTGNKFDEVNVSSGGRTVGRLPFKVTRHGPFVALGMPEFTHVLGPVVDAGDGKPQAQLLRRVSIIDELIDQLPRFDHFMQAFDSSMADLPAFQNRGFDVRVQYTFRIDCRNDLDAIWAGMRDKTRNVIRRAEERYSVVEVDEPEKFLRYYADNLEKRRMKNSFDFTGFSALFSECRARNCGEVLAACQPDGTPMAMVFLVWGHGVMYYLLSSRTPGLADNGAVSLLLWKGTQHAHRRNLVFDLDGVISPGAWRFLSGFGGSLATRFVASRSGSLYRVYDAARYWKNGLADKTDRRP
jgi:Acetyltransferase (GNAT) domain